MDITRATILKENIDIDLQPKLIFSITYIKNIWPIRVV